jgi:small redox-active disulfide protein 2
MNEFLSQPIYLSMKNIQILGTGCAKCQKLAAVAEDAAKDLGLEYSIEKVTDLNDIAGFGVMFTPALVVDGLVKVPGIEDIKKLLA